MPFSRTLASALAVCLLVASAAAAQPAAASLDDLFVLQDALYDAGREVSALRTTDAARADQLQRELDQARDEAVYLRVKLRKEGVLARSEVDAVRRTIDDVRARARGEAAPARDMTPGTAPAATTAPAPPVEMEPEVMPVQRPAGCGPSDVCVGQELDVRLQTPLDSGTAQVEDRFEATTIVSFYNEANELIPAGSLLQGVVSSVDRAGRTDRKGSLTLAFERITVRGRTFPIRATVTRAIESRGLRQEVGKISVGAGVGAIIGGILGGVGGAVAGTVVGAGGMVLATEGPDVRIPAGTILRVRFDSPVTIQ
jgi:TolA-binding protein